MHQALSLYRGILREIRQLGLHEKMRKEALSYISSQFKSHKLTGAKYCQANEAAIMQATTYLTMLESSRKHRELVEIYGSKGEHSPESAAKLVGLNMPKTPS